MRSAPESAPPPCAAEVKSEGEAGGPFAPLKLRRKLATANTFLDWRRTKCRASEHWRNGKRRPQQKRRRVGKSQSRGARARLQWRKREPERTGEVERVGPEGTHTPRHARCSNTLFPAPRLPSLMLRSISSIPSPKNGRSRRKAKTPLMEAEQHPAGQSQTRVATWNERGWQQVPQIWQFLKSEGRPRSPPPSPT